MVNGRAKKTVGTYRVSIAQVFPLPKLDAADLLRVHLHLDSPDLVELTCTRAWRGEGDAPTYAELRDALKEMVPTRGERRAVVTLDSEGP